VLDDRIYDITARRNSIAGRMIAVLEAVTFHGRPVDVDEAESLIAAANDLMRSVDQAMSDRPICASICALPALQRLPLADVVAIAFLQFPEHDRRQDRHPAKHIEREVDTVNELREIGAITVG
jgi:hypothetical protein